MTQPIIIVAHGSPSDPEPQERAVAALAARVGALMPGTTVGSATLAAPGRLEREQARLPGALLYPFFMARGFFTDTVMPKRAPDLSRHLAPFGSAPHLPGVVADHLRAVMRETGWMPGDTALLLAAHGSAHGRGNATAARQFGARLMAMIAFRGLRVGLLEETPALEHEARDLGQAICLPWFALQSGHMNEDVPEALTNAGFTGPVLPPFIAWAETPRVIALDIQRQRVSEAAE